jgi:hypothetical protein
VCDDGKSQQAKEIGEAVRDAFEEWKRGEHPAWTSGVFAFARALRGSPHLEHLTGPAALEAVEKVLAEWVDAKGTMRQRAARVWDERFDLDPDDSREEFLRSWDVIRCPLGKSPTEHALHLASTRPITFPRAQLSSRSAKYQTFLSYAAWLQVATGDADIYLPRQKTAQILDAPSPLEVGIWVQAAIRDRFICEVEKSTTTRAAKYLFDVRRVPMLVSVANVDLVRRLEDWFV